MAFSYHDYTGDNSTTQFSIPFTYQNTSEISVTVDGVAQTGLTFPSSSTVQLASAPASGTLVQVRRTTNLTARAVDFASGSVLTEEDLDDSSIQTFHASQEAIDRANDSIALDTDDKWDATSKVIKNVATPTANTDATNKAYVDTGANNAATSAAAALVSQNAAAASATAAANSATASAGSATTSANEATDSANSATASASSATASANSASAASTSESNAATSAATATTQAALATTNGAAQVSLATTQANNAAASATNSANSATASANSATAAAGSASTATTQAALATTNGAAQVALATTQATNAATSATAAANSATAAATSETNAANSAAAAAAAFDNFDDTYLGSKTSDPTVDNDGNALVSGALYFNSSANEMRVYDGANWIAASSAGTASLLEYKYTATAGQTTFSGSDDASNTLSYAVDNLIVTLNGVVLENGTDYTATSGTSVVLASGAAVSDELNVIAFKSFTTADMVSKTNGGTFVGAVTFDAGANFGDSDKAQFGAGNDLQIYHDGSNSYIDDAGGGDLFIRASNNHYLRFMNGDYAITTSENGDVGLRYDNSQKLVTTSSGVDVTGGLNTTGNVGIGTASPDETVQVFQTADVGNDYNEGTLKVGGSTTALGFQFGYHGIASGRNVITSLNNGGGANQRISIGFGAVNSSGEPATNVMTLNQSGNVGIGTTSMSAKTVINQPSSSDALIIQRAAGVSGNTTFSFPSANSQIAGTNHIILAAGGSERLRIRDSGGITFNGDTAAANALDDYEEGSWTPTFESSGASFSYSSQKGAYTKIGRLVHVIFDLALNANPTGTTTNSLKIASLPFTAGGISGFYGGAIGYYFNVNVNNSAREIVYQFGNGVTVAELKQSGDQQGEINLLANSVSNGSTLRGSMTFFQN